MPIGKCQQVKHGIPTASHLNPRPLARHILGWSSLRRSALEWIMPKTCTDRGRPAGWRREACRWQATQRNCPGQVALLRGRTSDIHGAVRVHKDQATPVQLRRGLRAQPLCPHAHEASCLFSCRRTIRMDAHGIDGIIRRGVCAGYPACA